MTFCGDYSLLRLYAGNPFTPRFVWWVIVAIEVRKTSFLRCHFILKMIFLPRQARDKYREVREKREMCFLQGAAVLCAMTVPDHRPILKQMEAEAVAGLGESLLSSGGNGGGGARNAPSLSLFMLD